MRYGRNQKINFNHLYYFYVLVTSGTYLAAANKLGITQPSLSSQIEVFEEWLGATLLEKDGRRKKPTKLGVDVYSYCEEIFTLVTLIESRIAREKKDETL